MKKTKKLKKGIRLTAYLGHLLARLFKLEAHVLLHYGRLVRITILLIAAAAAGLVFIQKPRVTPVPSTRTSIIDAKTVEKLQTAITDRRRAFTSPPQVQPRIFISPSPSPSPRPAASPEATASLLPSPNAE